MATTPKKAVKSAVKAVADVTAKPVAQATAAKAKVTKTVASVKAKTVASVKAKAKAINKPTSKPTAAIKKVTAVSRKNATAAVNMTRDASIKLIDSQRAVWLAGLGALAKASSAAGTQGEKAFEKLVKAGETMESQGRVVIDKRAASMKKGIDAAATKMDKNINQFSKTFDAQVEMALDRLGFPKADAFKTVLDRLTDLSKSLEAKVRGGLSR
jgi:poly(hydroxyalkanoate) granule-associated protein